MPMPVSLTASATTDDALTSDSVSGLHPWSAIPLAAVVARVLVNPGAARKILATCKTLDEVKAEVER